MAELDEAIREKRNAIIGVLDKLDLYIDSRIHIALMSRGVNVDITHPQVLRAREQLIEALILQLV